MENPENPRKRKGLVKYPIEDLQGQFIDFLLCPILSIAMAECFLDPATGISLSKRALYELLWRPNPMHPHTRLPMPPAVNWVRNLTVQNMVAAAFEHGEFPGEHEVIHTKNDVDKPVKCGDHAAVFVQNASFNCHPALIYYCGGKSTSCICNKRNVFGLAIKCTTCGPNGGCPCSSCRRLLKWETVPVERFPLSVGGTRTIQCAQCSEHMPAPHILAHNNVHMCTNCAFFTD
jgi:hypothetical protein